MSDPRQYLIDGIASFDRDPAATDFHRGYEACLRVILADCYYIERTPEPEKIKEGDIVSLKSGGPHMTVHAVRSGYIDTQYFSHDVLIFVSSLLIESVKRCPDGGQAVTDLDLYRSQANSVRPYYADNSCAQSGTSGLGQSDENVPSLSQMSQDVPAWRLMIPVVGILAIVFMGVWAAFHPAFFYHREHHDQMVVCKPDGTIAPWGECP